MGGRDILEMDKMTRNVLVNWKIKLTNGVVCHSENRFDFSSSVSHVYFGRMLRLVCTQMCTLLPIGGSYSFPTDFISTFCTPPPPLPTHIILGEIYCCFRLPSSSSSSTSSSFLSSSTHHHPVAVVVVVVVVTAAVLSMIAFDLYFNQNRLILPTISNLLHSTNCQYQIIL